MALPKVADARKLSDEDLAAEILTAKQRLFELRLQKATRRLEKTHEFKHIRHWIAQLLTVEHERQRATEPTAEPTDAAETDAIAEPLPTDVVDEPAAAVEDEPPVATDEPPNPVVDATELAEEEITEETSPEEE